MRIKSKAFVDFCHFLWYPFIDTERVSNLADKKQYFRELDELGRIVPPVAFRKKLHIEPGDALEFWMEDDTIVMRKVEAVCTFCGSKTNVVSFKDSNVCKACIEQLKKI